MMTLTLKGVFNIAVAVCVKKAEQAVKHNILVAIRGIYIRESRVQKVISAAAKSR